MADEPKKRPPIVPDDTLEYISKRLMEIEAAIYHGPDELRDRRDEVIELELAAGEAADELAAAESRALLSAPEKSDDGRKWNANDRAAHVYENTVAEREKVKLTNAVVLYAKSKYERAKDINRAYDREKDALQTRSANLRAQLTLAGSGR